MSFGIYTGVAFVVSGSTVTPAANATIEVRREDTSALASIFSDRAGTTPITNPSAFADSEGRFAFYADGIDAGYKIQVTKDTSTYTLRYQPVGTARDLDQADYVSAANPVPLITTKGDTVYGGASGAAVRKAVPADTYVRVADSTQTEGWRDISPAALANSSPAFTRKNAIINGDFSVWQRGTSFASIASGAYSADRWAYQKVGAMVHDVSRSTDVPTVAQAGRLFNYSLLVDCQTIDASIAAGDVCVLSHRIEGFNWLPLAQRAITLSFWIKASKTGVHCVSLNNSTGAADRAYAAEFTVNAANTWENKTVTITASPSAGTWNYTTGMGVEVSFCLAAGSDWQTTAAAWQTVSTRKFATANQVNACDSAANDFRICGVQLEAGSVATEFEQRDFVRELELCQRYYEKSYDLGTTPGTSTTTGSTGGSTTTEANFYSRVYFNVRKRVAPTVSLWSNGGGANQFSTAATATDSASSLSVTSVAGESGFAAGNATTASAGVWYQYAASAEL